MFLCLKYIKLILWFLSVQPLSLPLLQQTLFIGGFERSRSGSIFYVLTLPKLGSNNNISYISI